MAGEGRLLNLSPPNRQAEFVLTKRLSVMVDEFVSSVSMFPRELRDETGLDEFFQRQCKFVSAIANSRPAFQREHAVRPFTIAMPIMNYSQSFSFKCSLATNYSVKNIFRYRA